MRTEALIKAIARDAAAPKPWLAGRMAAALIAGGVVSALLFTLNLGVRPDLAWVVLIDWRFPLKLAIAALSLAAATWAARRLVRPEARARDVGAALAVAPVVLALAVGYELMTLPPAEWAARAIGTNARICLISIPLLSVAPLAAMLIALRAGAPRSTALAGTVAGLIAGGLGATLYATHCTDDSPLFVALWYPIGIALVALAGRIAGERLLRW
jgi:hypothetical protein